MLAISDQTVKDIIAERDRLKSNLFSMLFALQCRDIEDLMTKGAEHFAAVGVAITDGYTDKASECIHLKQLLREWIKASDVGDDHNVYQATKTFLAK